MTRSETDFAGPGTYALILACRQTGSVRIGRLSRLDLQPGYYVYVGSALGTGGLQARLRHHLQIPARPHWHIDYLRAVCDVREVWFTSDTARFEHRWAKVMAGLPGAGVPLPRFGSSDCACVAHLFSYARVPSIRVFRQQVKTPVSRSVTFDFARSGCHRASC